MSTDSNSDQDLLQLYAKWSSSRQDSLTKVGPDFDPLYDGTMTFLGYIFKNKGDGRVPLYMKWSSSRQDSLTKVGSDFESIYDGTLTLLGYIFKDKQPGTVPIYVKWSTSRLDSLTKVGSDFESMYDGTMTLLGWIRPGAMELVSIDYDTKNGMAQETLSDLVEQDYRNDSDTTQEQSVEVAHQKTTTHTFSWNNSIEVGVTVTGDIGVPFLGDAGIEISAKDAFTLGEEDTASETDMETQTFPINIPPKSRVQGTFSVYNNVLTVPYVATFQVKDEYNNVIDTWQSKGTYKGVSFSQIRSSVKQTPL